MVGSIIGGGLIMPYVNKESRESISENNIPQNPGELNYLITISIDDYLNYHGLNYQHINDVVGVLECAKMELYRRIAIPYEDVKKEKNGDVYSKQNTIGENIKWVPHHNLV